MALFHNQAWRPLLHLPRTPLSTLFLHLIGSLVLGLNVTSFGKPPWVLPLQGPPSPGGCPLGEAVRHRHVELYILAQPQTKMTEPAV